MILDKIEKFSRYQLPQEGFESLRVYLNTFNKDSFQKGRFDIKGDTLFGIGLVYDTKEEDQCLWEAHRRYIDIHFIIDGEEKVFINDINNMEISKSYDETEDYELFEGHKRDEVVLRKGDFLILNPNEVHKTSIRTCDKVNVIKIVFKLKIS